MAGGTNFVFGIQLTDVTNPSDEAIRIGTFTGATYGTGYKVSGSRTAAMKIYSDDGGAAIGSGYLVRSIWGRLLMNYTGTQECEAFGIQGNVVYSTCNPNHNDGGVMGSWEARGTVTTAGTASDNIHAGVVGRVGAGSGVTLTVSANSILAGLAAMSNINTGASATYTGVYTGLYVAAWASADDFEYGIYVDDVAHGAYFNVDGGTLSGEEHAIDIDYTGTLSSGDSMVGLDVAVTTGGTAGTWVSGIYAKVTQGSTKNVNGYISAAEFEVVNSAGSVSDWFVLVLNASNSGAQQGSHSSYIALRDYGSTDIQSLLWVSTDHTIGTKSDTALMTTFADGAHISHAIRFIAGSTPYWLLCSSQVPSGT